MIEVYHTGRFQRIIPDPRGPDPDAKRILLCAGKIFYDLLAERDELQRDDVAIVRLEQLYPLHPSDVKAMLEPYATDASQTSLDS